MSLMGMNMGMNIVMDIDMDMEIMDMDMDLLQDQVICVLYFILSHTKRMIFIVNFDNPAGYGQPGFVQPGFVQPGFPQPGFVQPVVSQNSGSQAGSNSQSSSYNQGTSIINLHQHSRFLYYFMYFRRTKCIRCLPIRWWPIR